MPGRPFLRGALQCTKFNQIIKLTEQAHCWGPKNNLFCSDNKLPKAPALTQVQLMLKPVSRTQLNEKNNLIWSKILIFSVTPTRNGLTHQYCSQFCMISIKCFLCVRWLFLNSRVISNSLTLQNFTQNPAKGIVSSVSDLDPHGSAFNLSPGSGFRMRTRAQQLIILDSKAKIIHIILSYLTNLSIFLSYFFKF
jgi:hypothetical protein